MASNATSPEPEFGLSNCDREPINIPAGIQPHGLLLALEEPSMRVLQASLNVRDWLGVEDVVGSPVEDVVGPALARLIRAAASNASLSRNPLFLGSTAIARGGKSASFDPILHRSDEVLVLELEPVASGGTYHFGDLYGLVRSFLNRIEGASSVLEVCQMAAAEVRRMTGVDRVLIYRFDPGWNGTVIAEDRNDVLPSYLDLRFPASDIPAQARELYKVNRIRLIASADYTPVPIVPATNPRTGRPLDLSFSSLRSVSPIHLEYMRNMGTGSSMSISILRDGELWGLISCHNKAPRVVPFEVRIAGDLLGQVISLQVVAKEQRAEYENRLSRQQILVRLLAGMTEADDFVDGLVRESRRLLGLVEASGAAIFHDGQCTRLGLTPEPDQINRIADWLEREPRPEPFATDKLAAAFPDAEEFKDHASGLLAVSISKLHRGSILWFRPEVVRTVEWGGDPRKAEDPGEDGRIHPRRSFEAWKEVVRLEAKPWRTSEVEAAASLRNAIVDIVLRQAEERAQLSSELERSNKELEAFSYSVSHDLRAPFRHIVGYSEMLREEEGAGLSPEGRRYIETIIESAQYAGTLVDNLLAFSRMGRTTINRVPIDTNVLIRDVIAEVMIESGGRSIRWNVGNLPQIDGDYMMMRLAFSNLASNAVKYTRPREVAEIDIAGEMKDGEVLFTVKDNGIGFDMRYADKLFGVFQRLHRMEEFEGTGIGLANVRRIMSRHNGRAWGQGEVNRGASFYLSMPGPGGRRSSVADPSDESNQFKA